MARLRNELLFYLHSSIVFFSGVSVGYSIQWWKLQRGIDSSLFNLRFLSLAVACGLFAYSTWLLVTYVYARLRRKEIGTVLQVDAYSYCTLFSLPYYPYLDRSIAFAHFAEMAIVYYLVFKALLFVASELGKPLNFLRFSYHGKISSRIFFSVCIILGMCDLYQTSLASHVVRTEGKKPFMIDLESRKCKLLPWDKTTDNEVKLPKGEQLNLAYGFTDEMIARGSGFGIPKTLRVWVREQDSGKEQVFSFPIEHSTGWHDIRLRLEDLSLHRGPQASIRVGTRTLIPWLFKDPFAKDIAIADPFVTQNSRPERPNVIMVSIDALRADHIHALGYPKDITKNIDYLASDGVAFGSAISAGTWTIPSNIALITSIFSERNSGSVDMERLPHYTLTEAFARNNYLTAAITDGGWISSETAFMHGFNIFEESRCVSTDCRSEMSFGKAERLIDYWKDSPFFLWIYTDEVHNTTWHPIPECGECNPDKQQTLIENYDVALETLDNSLGKFVDYLKDRGLYERTILLLTADHGNAFGEDHNDSQYVRCGHGGMPYNEQIIIPLIIKPQEGEAFLRGQIIPGYVSNIDIAPTVLELAGLKIPEEFEGISLVSAARGMPLPENRRIWSSQALPPAYWVGVIKGRYKMIYPKGKDLGGIENTRMYDLSRDPAEKVNIFKNTPKQLEMLRDMKNYNDEGRKSREPAPEANRVTFSPDLSDQLRGLGYLQ